MAKQPGDREEFLGGSTSEANLSEDVAGSHSSISHITSADDSADIDNVELVHGKIEHKDGRKKKMMTSAETKTISAVETPRVTPATSSASGFPSAGYKALCNMLRATAQTRATTAPLSATARPSVASVARARRVPGTDTKMAATVRCRTSDLSASDDAAFPAAAALRAMFATAPSASSKASATRRGHSSERIEDSSADDWNNAPKPGDGYTANRAARAKKRTVKPVRSTRPSSATSSARDGDNDDDDDDVDGGNNGKNYPADFDVYGTAHYSGGDVDEDVEEDEDTEKEGDSPLATRRLAVKRADQTPEMTGKSPSVATCALKCDSVSSLRPRKRPKRDDRAGQHDVICLDRATDDNLTSPSVVRNVMNSKEQPSVAANASPRMTRAVKKMTTADEYALEMSSLSPPELSSIILEQMSVVNRISDISQNLKGNLKHDLRVAARRTRAAVSLFARHLFPATARADDRGATVQRANMAETDKRDALDGAKTQIAPKTLSSLASPSRFPVQSRLSYARATSTGTLCKEVGVARTPLMPPVSPGGRATTPATNTTTDIGAILRNELLTLKRDIVNEVLGSIDPSALKQGRFSSPGVFSSPNADAARPRIVSVKAAGGPHGSKPWQLTTVRGTPPWG